MDPALWFLLALAAVIVGYVVYDRRRHGNDAQPAPPAVPRAADVALRDRYPTAGALLLDAANRRFEYEVTLDGETLRTGFGPPLAYVTQADGSLAREQRS